MFTIEEKPFGKFKEYVLTNTSTQEYVSVLSVGATLNQVVLRQNQSLYPLLDGNDTYEAYVSTGRSVYKGTFLFPFANRIEDGQYTFDGSTYRLPINLPDEQHAHHGLMATEEFECTERYADALEARLVLSAATDGTVAGYPFHTSIKISFIFSAAGISICTEVENTGTKAAPVGIGWHPYFRALPEVDGFSLSLPVVAVYETNARNLPTGTTLSAVHVAQLQPVARQHFDTGYRVAATEEGLAEAVLCYPGSSVRVVVWQESGAGKYNFLQVYTPVQRRSIALEPMTSAVNAFNNGIGLLRLEPGQKQTLTFGIRLA
jgi:aldose 1-epimerase